MSDVLVILGGIAAIAWVNWYFFLADRRADRSASNTRQSQ